MRLLLLFSLFVITNTYSFEDCVRKPISLSNPQKVKCKESLYSLDFYHQNGLKYNPVYAFTDVFLSINLTDPDAYHFYQGKNCTEVQSLYDNDNRYFGMLKRAAILRSHQLSPFEDTVIGVSTTEPYEISTVMWKVNYVRVGVYVMAIILFLLAGSLVRNVVFYYTSGCSFGLLASLLLVAFIVWRVAPKKTIGVPILIGGWSVSLYMLHFAWANLQSIMIEYQKYVIGYFATVLLVSLAVCYKRGPPTDARSHDIAQWTLQLIAIALIYFSSQVVEVSIGTIGALIIQQLSKGVIFTAIRWYFVGLQTFWRRMFPKPRRLLTEDEYEELGRKTTKEQLDQLRDYCRQDSSRPWKLAEKVRSSRRLARFVEGDDGHVTEDEIYAHDMTGEELERYDDDEEQDYSDDNRPRYNRNRDVRSTDEDDEWDEIVVKRRPSVGNHGATSIHSIRVPRHVSSRLLSPYGAMNRSLNNPRTENEYNRKSTTHQNKGRNAVDRVDHRETRRPYGFISEYRPTRAQVDDSDDWYKETRQKLLGKIINDDHREKRLNDIAGPSDASSSSSYSSAKSSRLFDKQRRVDRLDTTPTRTRRTRSIWEKEIDNSEGEDEGNTED